MPPEGTSQNREDGTPIVRYYKSQDPSMEVIHVQAEDYWENLSFAGKTLVKGRTDFVEEDLAGFGEIDRAEAVQILGEETVRLREEEALRGLEARAERELKAEAEATAEPKAQVKATQPGPEGIGGWLVVVVIILLLTILANVLVMIYSTVPFLQGGNWSTLTTTGMPGYDPWWAPTIVFKVLANALMIVGPVVLLVLLGQRRRALPSLIIGFSVVLLVIRVAISLAVVLLAGKMREAGFIDAAGLMTSSEITGLVIAAVLAAIWVPYFLLSKRVKRTFVGRHQIAAESSTETSTSRKPRIALIWASGALVVIALVVLGALVWRDSTLAKEQENLYVQHGDVKTYTDPDFGYSFDYPADWILQQSIASIGDMSSYSEPGSAFVIGPYGTAETGGYGLDMMGVVVHELGYVVGTSELQEINERITDYLGAFQAAQADFEIVTPVTQVNVAGLEGFTAKFTESFNTGQGSFPLTTKGYWLFDGTREYDLILQAKTANLRALEDQFDAFLASFTPGPTQ